MKTLPWVLRAPDSSKFRKFKIACVGLQCGNIDMAEAEALSLLKKLDPDSLWRAESQLPEAMAAICTLFHDEWTNTAFSGADSSSCGHSYVSCQHEAVQRREIPAHCTFSQVPLLPSGLPHRISHYITSVRSMFGESHVFALI